MKKTNIYTAIIALMVAVTMTSCGESVSGGTASNNTADGTNAANTETAATKSADEASSVAEAASQVTSEENQIESVVTESGSTIDIVSASYTANTSGILDTQDLFSDRDLRQNADLSEAKTLEVKDGETVNITEGGIYVVSGTAGNCTIRIEVDENDKVQLILDGVSITNDDSPAIYVVSADKCFITTAEGSVNELSVMGSFTADGETNTDAVIYSKDDLVFNGLGSLSIVSAQGNGISCKDDIKFTGGTYSIDSSLDAVEANDSISVCGGSFTINSDKDGLHSENEDDGTQGSIYIAGGTFDITASGDGIQGATYTQIDGGEYTISASEGIECTYIQINGGTIVITATDDGVNVSNKSNSVGTPTFEMNGGSLTVTVTGGDVDAIDANGNISVAGGTIDITYPGRAPCDSFDYDGTATYTGGSIIINGEQVDSIPQPSMMSGFGGDTGDGMPGDFGDLGGFGDGNTPTDHENMGGGSRGAQT